MTNLKLSNNIYITGTDGKCYRHTVTFTPSSHTPLTQTKGVLFWKKEVPNPEALRTVEEQVHALALAHITQYGKDFQTATINETGATFDNGNTQTHDFSITESGFTQKMSNLTNQLATQKFDQYVKTQPSTHQVKDLFETFAGVSTPLSPSYAPKNVPSLNDPVKQTPLPSSPRPSDSSEFDDDSYSSSAMPNSPQFEPDTDYPKELYELPNRSPLEEEERLTPLITPRPVKRSNLDPLIEKATEVRSLIDHFKSKLTQPPSEKPEDLPENS